MLPCSDNFKRNSEISMTRRRILLFREGKGVYWDKDISELVVGPLSVNLALHDQSGGYAASISPTVIINVLQDDEIDSLMENLTAGDLSIRVYVSNFIGDDGGDIPEEILLFEGKLWKQVGDNLDVYGKVYKMAFAHPLVVLGDLGKIDLKNLPDPYDYEQMNDLDKASGKVRRRDLFSIFKALKFLIKDPDHGANVNFNLNLYALGDKWKSVETEESLFKTHTPISRKENGTTWEGSEYTVLGSSVENFVKVRGIAYNESEDILIVGIDEIRVSGSNEVTHTPKLVYLTLEDDDYNGFLRMESRIVSLNYTGDPGYKCEVGYRILDLHYEPAPNNRIHYVIETARDDLGFGISYRETTPNEYNWRLHTRNEQSPRIYFGDVAWADRKNPKFTHFRRLKKYHKGIHIHSKRINWTASSNIDRPRGQFSGLTKGTHYSEMIGHGTPKTDRKIGVPFPLKYLVGYFRGVGKDSPLVPNKPISEQHITFEYLDCFEGNVSYLKEYLSGGHVYILEKGGEGVGNISYLGTVTDFSVGGKYSVIKGTTYVPVFRYFGFSTEPQNIRVRIVIIRPKDHPEDNIPVSEYSSLEMVYENFNWWSWKTKEDIIVEKKRDFQQKVNYYWKDRYATLSESNSFELDPGIYSFSASPEIEGFSAWQEEAGKTEGTWTSAQPMPFHLVFKSINDSNQFKWRYHDGALQRFAVCNNSYGKGITERERAHPDFGRDSANTTYFNNVVMVWKDDRWRPVEWKHGGKTGVLESYGNIWISKDENDDLWFFVNDFEEAEYPVESQTGKDWFNNCRIYKWVDAPGNFPNTGGYLVRKFVDRVNSPSHFGYYNSLGNDPYTGEENQVFFPPKLFTGPGIHVDGKIYGGRKVLRYSRGATGVKVLGAFLPGIGSKLDGVGLKTFGIRGYEGGAQAGLVLGGNVSERYSVGDEIELRWWEQGKSEPESAPHVIYRIVDTEVRTADFSPDRVWGKSSGGGNNDGWYYKKGAYKFMKEGYTKYKPGTKEIEDWNPTTKLFGLYTLITIESVHIYPPITFTAAEPQNEYGTANEYIQNSIVKNCVEREYEFWNPRDGSIGKTVKEWDKDNEENFRTLTNIRAITNRSDYYYIYKVGKKWEFADQYRLENLEYGIKSMTDFRYSYNVLSKKYSETEQTRLTGEQYKFYDKTELGETLTPSIDTTYSKLPYVTLSKERYDYFQWQRVISGAFFPERDRTQYLDINNEDNISKISVKLKDSEKLLSTTLIFDDSDVKEPVLSNVLVKPNSGDNKTECRLYFNRELEGVDVLVDYYYFVEGYYDGFHKTPSDNPDTITFITNSVESPEYKKTEFGAIGITPEVISNYPIQDQTGTSETPVYCGRSSTPSGTERYVTLSSPDGILMVLNNLWPGYIEETDFRNSKTWNLVQSLAMASNCYAIPDSVRYNEKWASGDPMNISLYPRSFKGINVQEVSPIKIERIQKKEYDSVVVNYKYGKASVYYNEKEGEIVDGEGVVKLNKYEISCNLISNHKHALTIARTVLQWLVFKKEYKLDLGHLASWLQPLDAVKFRLKDEINKEGEAPKEVWEQAFVINAKPRIGDEGDGTNTLRVVSYRDIVGDPFEPGNPGYKQEPQQEEVIS